MSFQSKQSPIIGQDGDNDEIRIEKNKARFIKNLTFSINNNPDADVAEGQNAGVLTPLESNVLQTGGLTLPGGINYTIGSYEAEETGEVYIFNWNSNSLHHIYRINRDGSGQMVYQGECLNFRLEPKYRIIENGRVAFHVERKMSETGVEAVRKYLIFTDTFNPQRFISVEDSIASNSFNATTFPYFNSASPDNDPCNYINLGVPTPMSCIGIEQVRRTATELKKPNVMLYKGWQWRVKFIDIWGRESEHGIISDRYFPLVGASCIATSPGLARCVDLTFDSGSPLVNKIQIEFRTCSGGRLNVDGDWYLYDTIDKYNNCTPGQKWFQRAVSNPWKVAYDAAIAGGKTTDEATVIADGKLKYNAGNNKFTYRFCGDKECTPLPVDETGRVQNALALRSNSVANLDRGIVLVGNLRGFDPLNCAQLDKLSFGVVPPSAPYCPVKTYKVKIYAMIYNPFLEEASLIRYGIKDSGFAGFGQTDCNKNNPLSYDQYFPKGQKGWVGYLAGTQHNVICKQYNYDPATNTEVLDIDNSGFGDNGHFALLCWEFDALPPGTYCFRMASHRATPSMDFQRTSTYVVGRTDRTNIYADYFNEKELVFSVTTADLTFRDRIFKIWDLTRDARDAKVNLNDCWADASTLVDGYLYEDKISRIPIEMAACYVDADSEKYSTTFTDHNGFFFGASKAKNTKMVIDNITDCDGTKDMYTRSAIDNFNAGGHIKHDELYMFENVAYPDYGRRHVTGRIVLCSNPDVGVAGVAVVLTRSAWAITDVNGNFNIIAHQRYNEYAESPANRDNIIVSQRGGCRLLDCDGDCESSFDLYTVPYLACGGNRTHVVPNFQAAIQGAGRFGPTSGGRHGMGIVMHDWMGRQSFVQASDKHYVDIPSLIDIQRFDYSRITWSMDPSIRFPSWVKRVTFYITENLNFDDFLSWAVDRFQLVDNTGNINTAAPTKMRLYYASLGEYNKQNNLATNTTWQIISNTEGAPTVGDRVEFIMNGDGTWFTKKIEALVTFDKTGTFFTIDYTEDLKDLKPGALIRLIRPKRCINRYLYYEQCGELRIENGIPAATSGEISYFDSYMQNRQLPVPIEKVTDGSTVTNPTSTGFGSGSATGTNPTTTGSENNTQNVATTSDNLLTAYPFLFEHHSPADLWGDHCVQRGRVNTKNPNEKEVFLGSEFHVSKVILNKGSFNGLSYFDTADITTFDEQDWGEAIAVLVQVNIVLVICTRANYTVGFKDNTARMSAENVLEVPSNANGFGKPNAKIGNVYGCQKDDVGTIQRQNGAVVWLDRAMGDVVLHTFADASGVARQMNFQSWLTRKIAAVNAMNATRGDGKTGVFIGGMDPKTGEYFLTHNIISGYQVPRPGEFSQLPEPTQTYVNLLPVENVGVSETLSLDLRAGVNKGHRSFTPEWYARLKDSIVGNDMFSFKGGQPWSHHPGFTSTVYNNFYGTQAKKVIVLITNDSPEKIKRYLSNAVYCREHKFVIDQVKTESGQLSRLPAPYWIRAEKFWSAPILCAINTPADPNMPNETGPNALVDGDLLYGAWLQARYISEDADDPKYCELRAIVMYLVPSEHSAT